MVQSGHWALNVFNLYFGSLSLLLWGMIGNILGIIGQWKFPFDFALHTLSAYGPIELRQKYIHQTYFLPHIIKALNADYNKNLPRIEYI